MSSIPKYQEIIDYIRSEIKSNHFSHDCQLPTEQELSEQFGTSRPTVVKAMDRLKDMGIIYRVQGRGSFVAEQKAEASDSSSRIISVVMPFAQYRDVARIDEMNILKGIEHRLNQRGYYTMIHYCNDDGESFVNTFKSVQNSLSVGIIAYVAKGLIECNDIYELFMGETPLVLIDKSILGANSPCIRSDNVKGGFLATEHLAECGYQAIYFLTDYNITYNESFRERYVGFCQGVQANKGHVTFGHYMMDPQDNDMSQLEATAKQLLERHPNERIGLFCTGDYFAEKVYKVFSSLGADIPGKIGIVGFDGLGISLPNNRTLTTVAQDFYGIGKVASETILKILNNHPVPPETVKTDVKLVPGQTTSFI